LKDPANVRCPHCGADISAAAAACGFCGKPVGRSWLLRPVLTGLILGCVLGLLAAAGLWLRAALRRAAAQAAAAAAEAAPAQPAVTDPAYDSLLARAGEEEAGGGFRMAAALLMQAMSLRPQRPEARENLERLREKLMREHKGLALATPESAAAPAPAAPAPDPQENGLVHVPEGSFLMGAGAPGGSPDEYPAHEVSLSAFGIEAREVTAGDYRRFCAETGRPFPRQPSWSTPRHPVVSVTWHEAQAYCRHLGRRLPTEAEWERSARCGADELYLRGAPPESLAAVAWFSANSGGRTHPVGTRSAVGCGLFDAYGNVWEWTADWYSATTYDVSPRKAPPGPRSGEEKVLRGGAFDSPPESLNPTFRDKFSPDHGAENRGFRCAQPRP
jgi:formylglycine-generating enzyme required for sulfatase activity